MEIENIVKRMSESELNGFANAVARGNDYLERMKTKDAHISGLENQTVIECGNLGIVVEGNKISTHT